MSKVLSFIVPAYNSASTLRRCLDSFLVPPLFDRIEVLIVNDGSTDSTQEVAKLYADTYPCFRLISKQNGGHGSVINMAVGSVSGKYFKVVDSDDWIKSENLAAFVDALESFDADVVFTHFRTIDSRNGRQREYNISNVEFGRAYTFEEYWRHRKSVFQACCFHGITYKTDFYKLCGIKLSEGISYEDQEYSTLPFAHVKTVVPLNISLYEYSIGDPNQSMSDANQAKRLSQREQVLWKLIDAAGQDLTETAADYFMFKKREFMLGFYMAALVKNPSKPDGRKITHKLRQKLDERGQSALLKAARVPYLLCLFLSYFGRFGNKLLDLRRFGAVRSLAVWIRGGGNVNALRG